MCYAKKKKLCCVLVLFSIMKKKKPTNLTKMKAIHHSQSLIMTASCNMQMERKKLQKKTTHTKLESDSLLCVLCKL